MLIPYALPDWSTASYAGDKEVAIALVNKRCDDLPRPYKQLMTVEEMAYGVAMASPDSRKERKMEKALWAELGTELGLDKALDELGEVIRRERMRHIAA